MKNRSIVIGAAIAAGAIGITLLYLSGGPGSSSPDGASSAAVVQRLEGQNRTTFKSALEQFTTRLHAARASMTSEATDEDAARLRVGVLREAFSRMHDANRMLARDELRGAIMDDLI